MAVSFSVKNEGSAAKRIGTGAAAATLLFLVLLACCCVGRYSVSYPDVMRAFLNSFFGCRFDIDGQAYNSVMLMRFPRVIMSCLVGMALSVSGCVYQSVFNNKLISPDLLGVSNGSCVGAAIAIMFGGAGAAIMGNAFLGGLVAVALALLLPVLMHNSSNLSLVLSGIVVSALFSSALGLIKYAVDSLEKLEAITFWIMGSFSSVTMHDIQLAAPFLLPAFFILLLLRHRINIVSLGETDAVMLGVNFKAVRIIVILCATVLTSCSTAICGTVSWVGLIVPHISRMLVGTNNDRLLPCSAFIGATVLPIIDTLCRTLTITEIPISILSAAFGALFYAIILIKKGRSIHD